VHEVNTVAAGLNFGRWLPAWVQRHPSVSPGLTGSAPHPAKWILAASRLILVFTMLALAPMLITVVI